MLKKRIAVITAVNTAMITTLAVLVFMYAGCGTTTTAPVGATGFPVIDIVDAEVVIANDSRFVTESKVWARNPNTKIIGGTQWLPIVAKDIRIHLIDTSIQIPIKNNADLTEWFLNIPAGLKATADAGAKFAAEKGATDIVVTIDGIPEQVINQPIQIRVPYEVTNRSWDFHIPPDPDKRFEVYGVEIASIVVGGAVNTRIEEKSFKIKFGGTRLTDVLTKDTSITAWFPNIPPGITAVVDEDAVPVTEGQQSISVKMSGIPKTQVNEKIRVRIPAGITTANMILEIQPSDRAMYDIGSFDAIAAKDIEIQTGSNWKGVEPWSLIGPGLYSQKDFSAVGIIQIQSSAVYAIGHDGEFHWTGDSITYGKLMAEAKKMDAHAIIDVVIDYDDVVDETIEKRHIEAGHTPTILENIKMSKGLIKIVPDPNGGSIYEENLKITKRTWTGTALAIKYAPAYAPAVGTGTDGYIPARP